MSTGQSPWSRDWAAAYRLYAGDVCDASAAEATYATTVRTFYLLNEYVMTFLCYELLQDNGQYVPEEVDFLRRVDHIPGVLHLLDYFRRSDGPCARAGTAGAGHRPVRLHHPTRSARRRRGAPFVQADRRHAGPSAWRWRCASRHQGRERHPWLGQRWRKAHRFRIGSSTPWRRLPRVRRSVHYFDSFASITARYRFLGPPCRFSQAHRNVVKLHGLGIWTPKASMGGRIWNNVSSLSRLQVREGIVSSSTGSGTQGQSYIVEIIWCVFTSKYGCWWKHFHELFRIWHKSATAFYVWEPYRFKKWSGQHDFIATQSQSRDDSDYWISTYNVYTFILYSV